MVTKIKKFKFAFAPKASKQQANMIDKTDTTLIKKKSYSSVCEAPTVDVQFFSHFIILW